MCGKFYYYLVLVALCPVQCIAPFMTGAFIGGTLVASGLYAAWDTIKCPFSECCSVPWLKHDVKYFEQQFDQHVFGQHVVRDIVSKALRAHIRKQSPNKALVLSFHGWTGGGKNYVAKFVAKSLFKQGLDSKFVHTFISTVDFPFERNIDIYKLHLQDWIQGNVSACPQSLFIFDEIDKMHVGLIDAIKPFIDYHENIKGVDFRRSIFIFLSNTGGKQITDETLQAWEDGRSREDIQYSQLERLVNMGAFNEKGGLHKSSLIDKHLIDRYVPFLPLEKKHVKMCIEAEAARQNSTLKQEQIDSIIGQLTFGPIENPIYSTVGCKMIEIKVSHIIEEDI